MQSAPTQKQFPEDLPDKTGRSTNALKDTLTLILWSGVIIVLDTWTKTLVNRQIPVGGAWLPESLTKYLMYFRITHVHNKGTAFSMFAGADQINLIVSALAVVVAVFILVIYPRIDASDRALRVAVVLQLGGTVGNLISRIQYGYVLDFISVGNFAVFNIADASLVVGASLMVLAVILEEIRERKLARQSPPDSEADPLP